MKVLSLFDGMSCGQIALNRCGIKYDNYFASEIKAHAIKVTQHNYPNTIQLGDIRNVKADDLPIIDLIIGGSPCQDFSRGNREREGLDGVKSGLFFEYVRLLKECKEKNPDVKFLLENVVMELDDNNFITRTVGVDPIRINSGLVSAQLRDRFYWTNIPGTEQGLFGMLIEQPEDKGILLKGVLENGYCPMERSRCLLESDSRPLSTPLKMFHRFYSSGFTTLIFKSKQHYQECKEHYESVNKGCTAEELSDDFIYNGVRYFNQSELENLQTVPKGYTSILSRNNAACLLGLMGKGGMMNLRLSLKK